MAKRYAQPQIGPSKPASIIPNAVACASVVGFDSVSKVSVVGTPTRIITPSGIGCAYSSGQYHNVQHGFTGNSYTLIAIAKISHSAPERHILDEDDIGANRAFQLRAINYYVEFIPFDAGGTPVTISVRTDNAYPAKVCAVVARAGGGKTALDISGLGSASGTLPSHKGLSGSTYVGNFKGDTSYGNSDGVLAYAIVPGCLSDGAVAKILANPWQIFRAQSQPLLAVAGSTTNYALTPTGITTSSATLGRPALAQNHVVTGSKITASSALSSPVIAQNHALAGLPIVTGAATLSSPAMSGDAYNLTGASIIARPTLSSPSLTQNHALSGGAIAASSPVFGPITVAQQHALMASGITTSAPTLSLPILADGSLPTYSRAPSGSGYRRDMADTTRPAQQNTVRR